MYIEDRFLFKINNMTLHIDSRKIEILKKITLLTSEKDIADLERYLEQLQFRHRFKEVFKPMRDTISVEQLRKEQNYKVSTNKN